MATESNFSLVWQHAAITSFFMFALPVSWVCGINIFSCSSWVGSLANKRTLFSESLTTNELLGIVPDFETNLIGTIEQNHSRSSATARILRL